MQTLLCADMQVQTLYYVGDESPYVATAAQGEPAAGSEEAGAGPSTAAAAAPGAGKKRQRSGRRDKKQNKKAATKAAKEAAAAAAGDPNREADVGKENQPGDGSMHQTSQAAAAAGVEVEKGLVAAAAEPAPQNEIDGKSSSQQRVKIPEHAEKVLDFHNKTPIHDVFQFQRITGGLMRSGYYCLEYKLLPEGAALHAKGQSLTVVLQVAPSPAASFSVLVRNVTSDSLMILQLVE
jgi:hypothetical protein